MALLGSSEGCVWYASLRVTNADKMTGRCCFILILNPIVVFASLGDATQAYLVSTLLTTLDANKASRWVTQKGQHDHKYAISSLSA